MPIIHLCHQETDRSPPEKRSTYPPATWYQNSALLDEGNPLAFPHHRQRLCFWGAVTSAAEPWVLVGRDVIVDWILARGGSALTGMSSVSPGYRLLNTSIYPRRVSISIPSVHQPELLCFIIITASTSTTTFPTRSFHSLFNQLSK